MSSDASAPLMRQYNSGKQQVPNTLLTLRLGDFYELFFDDAVTAARKLEITCGATRGCELRSRYGRTAGTGTEIPGETGVK